MIYNIPKCCVDICSFHRWAIKLSKPQASICEFYLFYMFWQTWFHILYVSSVCTIISDGNALAVSDPNIHHDMVIILEMCESETRFKIKLLEFEQSLSAQHELLMTVVGLE